MDLGGPCLSGFERLFGIQGTPQGFLNIGMVDHTPYSVHVWFMEGFLTSPGAEDVDMGLGWV